MRSSAPRAGFPPTGGPPSRRDGPGTARQRTCACLRMLERMRLHLGLIPLTLTRRFARGQDSPSEDTKTRSRSPRNLICGLGPVALTMNTSAPVNAGGWISAAGYRFFLRGDMELKDLFRLENVLGLPVARPAAEGAAKLDVSVSGPWQGFAPPAALGTAQLRNVRAEMRGLNTPIEIGSANHVSCSGRGKGG